MRLKSLVLAGVIAGCTLPGFAQMEQGGEKVAVGSAVNPAKEQDVMYSMFEHEIMGVVGAMPADKFNFAPPASASAKFDGVRTFAQQAIHVAQANYFFFSSFGGPKPDVDVKGLSNLQSKDEIVSALQKSLAYGHRMIATITPANAYTGIAGADGLHTRASVASFAVAHGFDHYGQMVVYLRMNGVVPPGSK